MLAWETSIFRSTIKQNLKIMSRVFPAGRALRTFEAAARHLNFSRAADELGLTPAAVSYQIKDIEAQLGLALFARTSRSIRLTPAGEALAAPPPMRWTACAAPPPGRGGWRAASRRCACQWARALPRTGCCRVCRAFAPRIRNGS